MRLRENNSIEIFAEIFSKQERSNIELVRKFPYNFYKILGIFEKSLKFFMKYSRNTPEKYEDNSRRIREKCEELKRKTQTFF